MLKTFQERSFIYFFPDLFGLLDNAQFTRYVQQALYDGISN